MLSIKPKREFKSMALRIPETIAFDDILIRPSFSDIKSRRHVNLITNLCGISLNLPIISSPMDTVTEAAMAKAMSKAGGMGVIHRYNSPEEQADIASAVTDAILEESGTPTVAAAIGVTGDYIERATALFEVGVRTVCIDVAHGHHILMKEAITEIRKIFGDAFHIIAGNVATLDAFNDLSDWGANSVRVGIGGGSICSTRLVTGHGVPTLQSVIDCSATDRSAAIIADGGIRTSGDIVKALACGADAVMLGSMLAGTNEAPGQVAKDNETYFKVYRGMASVDAQMNWRGHTSSVEGVSSKVPCIGPVATILESLRKGVVSGLSYSGAKDLSELRSKAKIIRVTTSGITESKTHIDLI